MGGLLEELSEAEERDDVETKEAEKSRRQKKELTFFVENVTTRYVIAIQDLPKKQQNHVH